jgi:small subunit ribosomal protein S1
MTEKDFENTRNEEPLGENLEKDDQTDNKIDTSNDPVSEKKQTDLASQEEAAGARQVQSIESQVSTEADAEAAAQEDPQEVAIADPISEKPAEEDANEEVASEFDWDDFENDSDQYSKDDRAKFEALYDKTLSTINVNEVVDGTVISLNKREVVINIGYKSEAVISLSEFRYNPELKPGDKVEVYVESQEDKKGQLVLSHKKARALRSWDRVNASLENDEIIKGYIKCRTKGGMIVDVFGIEAFLPGSQIDVKPIRDYDAYVGKTMEFKVVKINHEFKNVVVSHKALIEEELEQQKKEIIAKLEKGQVLEGTVKNITSYGVFIDLGGVDGLIHITDLSWGRVNHPEEIVELDQKLNVVILDFDDAKKRIALGMKQLTPHPWDSLDPDLKVGDKVNGKVVVMADYGAFVEIAPGVEGLIHVSEMSWSQHLRSAQEFMKVGDKVEAHILTLDREERKMSLGIKQLKSDPWEKVEEKYPVGSRHSARVRNFTNFGVFVEIEEGVDGLIHISDLSWTKKIKHPAEFTAIGEEIEILVLEIDKENRRLSLGHKQLEENPWDVFETVFSVDSVHEGTIIEVFDKGALVALQYGVEGFVSSRHLTKQDGTPARVEEKLPFKVIEFSKSAKRIILSHTKVNEEDAAEKDAPETKKEKPAHTAQKTMRKMKTSLERTTLGDISELASLKEEMEENERDSRKKGKDVKSADTKSADTKSADTKSTDTKSTDTKSTDTKSTDTKSSDEKSADEKSADESADVKSKDVKSSDEKSTDESADESVDVKSADEKSADESADVKSKDVKSSDEKSKDAEE